MIILYYYYCYLLLLLLYFILYAIIVHCATFITVLVLSPTNKQEKQVFSAAFAARKQAFTAGGAIEIITIRRHIYKNLFSKNK
jgi:hypothetical protein